jgi:hypothetical protein
MKYRSVVVATDLYILIQTTIIQKLVTIVLQHRNDSVNFIPNNLVATYYNIEVALTAVMSLIVGTKICVSI